MILSIIARRLPYLIIAIRTQKSQRRRRLSGVWRLVWVLLHICWRIYRYVKSNTLRVIWYDVMSLSDGIHSYKRCGKQIVEWWSGYRHQLVWRSPSRKEERGFWFLLCQWYCFGYSGAIAVSSMSWFYSNFHLGWPLTPTLLCHWQVPPKSLVYWYWCPSRRWCGRGVLHNGSCHDLFIPQVWWILPWNRWCAGTFGIRLF